MSEILLTVQVRKMKDGFYAIYSDKDGPYEEDHFFDRKHAAKAVKKAVSLKLLEFEERECERRAEHERGQVDS